MKKNMGSADKIVRILIALVIAGLYFSQAISGTTAVILSVIAVIFLATAVVGFCPLYLPFGISTRKKQN